MCRTLDEKEGVVQPVVCCGSDREMAERKQIFIDDLAEVEDLNSVGDGTKIWRWTHVRKGAKIGRHCVIGQGCYVDRNVVIGDHVHVQNGVYVYEGVEVEDFVFVGPNVSFTNDLYPRAGNPEWKVTPTRVCYGSSIGAGAVIVCGVTIGEFAMVGAGSTVTRRVLPNTLAVGNPARFHGFVKEYLDGVPAEGGRRTPSDFFDLLAGEGPDAHKGGMLWLGELSEGLAGIVSGAADVFLGPRDCLIFRSQQSPDEMRQCSLNELDRTTQAWVAELLRQRLLL